MEQPLKPHGTKPNGVTFDLDYWGPGGPDLSKWNGLHCRMGPAYKDVGVEVAGPGQRRTFGGGRKTDKNGKRATVVP